MSAKKLVKKSKSLSVIKKPFTKSEIVRYLAEVSEIPHKQAAGILHSFYDLIEAHLGKKGPKSFVLPGFAKFVVIKKPARKARKGVNPFTGEAMMFKAKPAKNVIKIRPLKKLKDIVV
jgi:nucleoid DNA-binding protein